MIHVGLTGGIASGKSAVAAQLLKLGAVVIDADAIARQVVEPGTPALEQIGLAFGSQVFAEDGSLDRAALAAVVFADAGEREKLNAIVHPAVRAEAERLRAAAVADGAEVVVEDIPLLVESDQHQRFDKVLVVQAPHDERIRRMMEDRGWDRAEAVARMAAQATDEQRAAVADVVIHNDGSIEQLNEKVTRVFRNGFSA
ncbi:dephospho-CoA kinase [Glutamicibacter creatinolyticus]|uniref:Dephospho-CoA kinase n=3 Tax=Glutamicibacter creatinolyticus TaxID=162496 RepID=A0A5B7WTT5_9MICC|nr:MULTISPECIES: dephospho-CoA kinase [Glutamicibacter]QCY47428.1 Dephospho-CoA kinase [Glutamicibacter creatinolyticus]TLK49768.1 dephospho-CoA kinase [Glutamicibacter sp. V16R2B1]